MVVGSSQSGSQIAEELYKSGRQVYLSVSSAGRFPRRYRGKDIARWEELMGYYKRTVDNLKSPKEKFAPSAHGTGKDGGYTINLHQFARDGVILLGRVKSAHDNLLFLAQDLKENLKKADQFEEDLVKEIDDYIIQHHIYAPQESLPHLEDGYKAKQILELDLEKSNIQTIIWASGYRFDFSWVKLPVFDPDGYPKQNRGVTEYEGLYFIGLPFLHTGISGVIAGVGDDAQYISKAILERTKKPINTGCLQMVV